MPMSRLSGSGGSICFVSHDLTGELWIDDLLLRAIRVWVLKPIRNYCVGRWGLSLRVDD
jgi:hypothetical protein